MDVYPEYLKQHREKLISAKERVANKMAFAWTAYTKPCPSNACEMLTLVLLCVLISSTISSLLFVWMVFKLDYDASMAGIVSAVCAFVMLVLLILVHPVRCVITVTVPTLSTKQGRKIILSTALLYAITSCIPNINHNMSCSLQMLKCSTGNITHGVLESIRVPKEALKEITNTLRSLPSIENTEYSFQLDDNFKDVMAMKMKLFQTSDSIRAELTQVHSRMSQISHVLKKIIAALFVILLISSSVAYVNSYLTHIKHDNVYQSHQLMEALQKVSGDVTLPKSYKKKLVKTSGVWMSAQELKSGFWGLLALFIHALICGIMIGLDHFVYQSLQSLLSWASDIPEIRGTVHVSMTVRGSFDDLIPGLGGLIPDLGGMNKHYSYALPMLPQGCVQSLSAPDHYTLTSICVFLAIGFFMLLGEVFASRLRSKVCASFYCRREEQRTEYLLNKILEKRKRDNTD